VIDDARIHPLVRANGAVSDLGVVAYLGAPMYGPDDAPSGAICVIEPPPRAWRPDDVAALKDLSDAVTSKSKLRASVLEQERMLSQASRLGRIVERAAHGMFTIVNNNMVNGIRRVSVERGYDPRDFVLVAAGGAGSAHITALAREMGINRVLVPKLASGLCAFGQIISDVKYNYMATCPLRLEGDAAYAQINDTYAEIEETGVKHLLADGFENDRIMIRRRIDMRYVGQVHECSVDIENFIIDAGSVDQLRDAFHAKHEQLYTYSERNTPIEVVNLESTLYGKVDRPDLPTLTAGADVTDAIKSHRPMIFSPDGTAIDGPVYDGSKLGAGAVVAGPAVIEETTTTIVIEPDWQASLHESGSYILTRNV